MLLFVRAFLINDGFGVDAVRQKFLFSGQKTGKPENILLVAVGTCPRCGIINEEEDRRRQVCVCGGGM